MGTRSASQTAIGILAAFMENRTWRQAELADRLGVSSATVRRLMNELQNEQVDVVREAEGNQVYWSMPQSWAPNGYVLPRESLVSLLKVLTRAPSSSQRDELLARLTRLLPRSEVWRRRLAVVAPHGGPDDGSVLDEIETAAAHRVPLDIRYFSVSSAELTWRTVSIQRVLPPNRFLAWCHRQQALRWFRVESVVGVNTESNETYHEVAEQEVDEVLKASIGGFVTNEPLRELAFVVRSPESRWVRRNLPFSDARIDEDATGSGGIQVQVRTRATIAVARFVVGLGAAARAVSPDLARAVRTLAEGALEALSSDDDNLNS